MQNNKTDAFMMKIQKESVYNFVELNDSYFYEGKLSNGVLKFYFSKDENNVSKNYAYSLNKNLVKYFVISNPLDVDIDNDNILYFISPKTKISYVGDEDKSCKLYIKKIVKYNVTILDIDFEISEDEEESYGLLNYNPDNERYHKNKENTNVEFGTCFDSWNSKEVISEAELKEKENAMFDRLMKEGM